MTPIRKPYCAILLTVLGVRWEPDIAALEREIDQLVYKLGVYPAGLSAFFLAEGGSLTPATKTTGKPEEVAIVKETR